MKTCFIFPTGSVGLLSVEPSELIRFSAGYRAQHYAVGRKVLMVHAVGYSGFTYVSDEIWSFAKNGNLLSVSCMLWWWQS
jgi:hypothetical protein